MRGGGEWDWSVVRARIIHIFPRSFPASTVQGLCTHLSHSLIHSLPTVSGVCVPALVIRSFSRSLPAYPGLQE